MSAHDNDKDRDKEINALLSRPFIGACGVIIVLCGVVAGLWSTSIERDRNDIYLALAGIRKTMDERASLVPRLAELEKRTDDQEARIRAGERTDCTRRH